MKNKNFLSKVNFVRFISDFYLHHITKNDELHNDLTNFFTLTSKEGVRTRRELYGLRKGLMNVLNSKEGFSEGVCSLLFFKTMDLIKFYVRKSFYTEEELKMIENIIIEYVGLCDVQTPVLITNIYTSFTKYPQRPRALKRYHLTIERAALLESLINNDID